LVTGKERQHLAQMENKESKAIRQQKHDGQRDMNRDGQRDHNQGGQHNGGNHGGNKK
jgi:hypothetical protein